MEYYEIWNILENETYFNMEYFANGKVKRNILF